MKELLVADKYRMPLLEGEGGFYKWVNEHIKEIGRHTESFDWLTNGISLFGTPDVAEHFGGVGIWSTIIMNKFKPGNHVVYELDDDCLRQLGALFASKAKGKWDVLKGDAVETIGTVECDIAVLDFPSKTIRHYEEYQKGWSLLLDGVEPEYVIWTDASGRYLHTGANQKAYSKLLNTEVKSKEDYVEGLSAFMFNKHGYAITQCAVQQSYFVVMAQQVDNPGPVMYKWFRDGSQGLRII